MKQSTPTKVALVTGGSSGIGQATALEFAKLGHKVAITGRNSERLEAVLNELYEVCPARAQGAQRSDYFLALQVNFEDDRQVESVVGRVVGHFKALNILVNNAGYVGESHDLLDEEFYEDFGKLLQVNLLAPTRLSQMAAPHLMKGSVSNPGILINVSSTADRVPIKALGYCVSKAGLSMLTKVLANSLEGKNVRVLTVSPGPVRTSISPDVRVIEYMGEKATLMHRPGYASEVADLIVFLASEKASYMHASTIDIDGGHISKLGLMITEGLGATLSR